MLHIVLKSASNAYGWNAEGLSHQGQRKQTQDEHELIKQTAASNILKICFFQLTAFTETNTPG